MAGIQRYLDVRDYALHRALHTQMKNALCVALPLLARC